jgi:hypothetical protein
MPLASTPGTSGRDGTEPVATTSWSKDSSRSLPSAARSRTRTHRLFTSMATTSWPVRTSMPFLRCSSGERATSPSMSDRSSPTKYGMPHAEYDV